MRGGAAAAPPQAQPGRVTWAPVRSRRGAAARPGLSGLSAGKVSSLQVSINEGTNEPSPPFPAGEVRGGGVRGPGLPPQPGPSDPPAALFDFQRAAEASLTC